MHAWVGEGNGNPLQCSCLENPRDRGAWWAAVYGVAQSQTRLKRLRSSSSLSHYLGWLPCRYCCSNFSLMVSSLSPLHGDNRVVYITEISPSAESSSVIGTKVWCLKCSPLSWSLSWPVPHQTQWAGRWRILRTLKEVFCMLNDKITPHHTPLPTLLLDSNQVGKK